LATADLAGKEQVQGQERPRHVRQKEAACGRRHIPNIIATFIFELSFVACQFWI
jgi:hypothetical protein